MRRIFWGFCINRRFGIGPLHYLSSLSDFGFEFADILVIEKRRPDSPSRESTRLPIDTIFFKPLKVHKNENFFGFNFEFCTISMLVMHK
jgi:hypothetical protein